MGACTFIDRAKGKTAVQAFAAAVQQAKYEHGHGGYSGTIAEKGSFVEIPLPEGKNAHQYAEELLDNDDKRISDKWGPAGCIKIGDGEFLFFGWASS